MMMMMMMPVQCPTNYVVADQRFSLNNGLLGVLSLTGSENLVVVTVI